MNPRKQLTRRMEGFLRCRLAELHPEARSERLYDRPSIMISRQAGARGLEVGSKLADYLDQFDETAEHGWALFDQSLLARVIEDQQLPPVSREYLTPRLSATPPHDVVDTMLRTSPREWTLFQHSAETIRNLCRLGNVIILGRGANYLTQDLPNAFHVRLVGDSRHRATAVAAEYDLDLEKAGEYLESLDRARAHYVQRNLDRSIDDPSAYHLILNVSRLDPTTVARIIGDSLIEWAGSRLLPMSA